MCFDPSKFFVFLMSIQFDAELCLPLHQYRELPLKQCGLADSMNPYKHAERGQAIEDDCFQEGQTSE